MINVTDNEKIILQGHDSRGNQMKFKKDNLWYKTDFAGYQGLAEVVTSNILSLSNIESFVKYKEEQILYRNTVINGCVSENFKPDNADIITVSKLFHSYYGQSVLEVCKENNLTDTILHFVEKTANITKFPIDEIGKYITSILEVDALILNDDRHFNNIAFLRYNGEYMPAPLFDHGSSLLSDEMYYPMHEEVQDIIPSVTSRTFSVSFSEQKYVAESLFGHQFHIHTDDIERFLPINSIYDDMYLDRITEVLDQQLERYPDLAFGTLEHTLEKAKEETRYTKSIGKEREEERER